MKADRTRAKSKLYWKIKARQQLKREFHMSHREMRRYWDEPRAPLYGPLRLFSRWQAFRRRVQSRGSRALRGGTRGGEK